MGKDQELLEAARTGNLQAVKTILSGKLPRSSSGSGGLSGSFGGGLRRCEDDTPLSLFCRSHTKHALFRLIDTFLFFSLLAVTSFPIDHLPRMQVWGARVHYTV
jgi:hypothetical protein